MAFKANSGKFFFCMYIIPKAFQKMAMYFLLSRCARAGSDGASKPATSVDGSPSTDTGRGGLCEEIYGVQ